MLTNKVFLRKNKRGNVLKVCKTVNKAKNTNLFYKHIFFENLIILDHS